MINSSHAPPMCQWFKSPFSCALGRSFDDDSYCPYNCPEYLPVDSQELTDEIANAVLTIVKEKGIADSDEIYTEFMTRYPDLANRIAKRLEP